MGGELNAGAGVGVERLRVVAIVGGQAAVVRYLALVNAALDAGRALLDTVRTLERVILKRGMRRSTTGKALCAKLEKENKQLATRGLCTKAAYDLALQQGYHPPHRQRSLTGIQVGGVGDPVDVVVTAD